MTILDRHNHAYQNCLGTRLDADFFLYRALWEEIGPVRATLIFWCVRLFGDGLWRRARR